MTQYFEIVSVNSGKCLDVPNSSTADGARIQQYTRHGGHNQQWQITKAADGYQIIARHSGKALEVAGASMANGAHVDQSHINQIYIKGHQNQAWRFAGYANGTKYTIQALHSDKYLDVANGSTADHALVNQFEQNNQDNQLWEFYAVDRYGKTSPEPVYLSNYKIDFILLDLQKPIKIPVPVPEQP